MTYLALKAQAEYPQRIIWNRVQATRDWGICRDAYVDVHTKVMSRFAQSYLDFQDDFRKTMDQVGVKRTERGLFVPNKVAATFDGSIICKQNSSERAIYFGIPYLDNKKNWHIIAARCYSGMTRRGKAYFCVNEDTTKPQGKRFSVNNDSFIVIREHAIRRAMERSPIKTYENALGLILWILYKSKRTEGVSMRSVGATTDRTYQQEIKTNCVSYESFGKVVGTRFIQYHTLKSRAAAEQHAVVLIHTYLDSGMKTTLQDLSIDENDVKLTLAEKEYNEHIEKNDGFCTSCGKVCYGNITQNADNVPCVYCRKPTMSSMQVAYDKGLVVFISEAVEEAQNKEIAISRIRHRRK